jgi:hypothetical protein
MNFGFHHTDSLSHTIHRKENIPFEAELSFSRPHLSNPGTAA